MVQRMLGQPRAQRIVHDAPLGEGRCLHPALHAFDQVDVFDLEDLVEVADRFKLCFIRLIRLKEEIVGLERDVLRYRDDLENAHIPSPGVTHDAGVGPDPPNGVVGDRRLRHVVRAVLGPAGLGHVA